MVSIEKSYLDVAPGPELKLCWCLEWQGFKDFVKVLVGLLSGLEDAPGVVDSTRVSLKTEENFPSGRRAVDEGRSKGIEAGQVVGVDVAEEAGQRRSCMAVVPKVVNLGRARSARAKQGKARQSQRGRVHSTDS
jgi:hypothetical protein